MTTQLWYVLRSKPNKEDFLWGQLQARGIECFYPRTRVQTVNPRARKVRPYFPGYLFIHVDLAETGLSALQWMPGASGLVAFGGQPASVPETMINAIRNRVDQVNVAGGEVLIGLKKGETVTIQSGPFDGYEAIFDTRLSGNDRVRVLLNLINKQQLPVELPSGHIQRKPSPSGSSA
jgi:transcriptional antiterminator RfaH